MRVKHNVCVFTIRLNANEQLELYLKSIESIRLLGKKNGQGNRELIIYEEIEEEKKQK